jgi:hypothetical protein
MMWGGEVDQAVERSINRARQAEGEYEQEGGTKNFDYLRGRAEAHRAQLIASLGEGNVPKLKAIMAAMRTYKIYVGAIGSKKVDLIGNKRYVHGLPLAAARKVVAICAKPELNSAGKPLGLGMNLNGADNAIHIKLVEVTKGVHYAKGKAGKVGKPYEYHYFGWRTPIQGKEIVREGVAFTPKWKNEAVPTRKFDSLEDAVAARSEVGLNRAGDLKRAQAAAQAKRASGAKAVTFGSVKDVLVTKGLKTMSAAEKAERKKDLKEISTGVKEYVKATRKVRSDKAKVAAKGRPKKAKAPKKTRKAKKAE